MIDPAGELWAAVRAYYSFGFNLLAIVAGTKRPRSKWQQWLSTTQSWSDVEKMGWTDTAIGGIAAVCGEVSRSLVCLDLDRAESSEPLQALLDRLSLPRDYEWAVATPGGGYHIWLRCPRLSEHLRDKGILVGGVPGVRQVELRFTGHQTLLPPSLHPSGGTYEFLSGKLEDEPSVVDPRTLLGTFDWEPVHIRREVVKDVGASIRNSSRYVRAAIQREAAAVTAATEGKRNNTLNRAAYSLGQLEGFGLTREEVESVLMEAARSAGLTDDEIADTFASGWEAGRNNQRRDRYPTQALQEIT